MKKHSFRLVEWPRRIWQSLVRTTRRSHDPFLVYNMALFNYGGGMEPTSSESLAPDDISHQSIVFVEI